MKTTFPKILILTLISALFSVSCTPNNDSSQQNYSGRKKISKNGTEELNYLDTSYFVSAVEYLQNKGKEEVLNASSVADRAMLIRYNYLVLNGIKLSSDHTNRIYFSQGKLSLGNILNENGKIQVEMNYGVPDRDPKESMITKEKIWDSYKKLVDLALKH